MLSEVADFEEAADDIVGEVAEAESDVAEVLEAPVDGFGGAGGDIARAGAVEEDQYIVGAFGQCPAQASDLGQLGGDPAGMASIKVVMVAFAVARPGPRYRRSPAGRRPRRPRPPRDTPQRTALPGVSPVSVGEEVGAGAQGPPGAAERVSGAAASAEDVLLGASPALSSASAARWIT